MTEKTKAKELIDSYRRLSLDSKYNRNGLIIGNIAKECAVVFADHMIEETRAKQWYDIKREIENYKVD